VAGALVVSEILGTITAGCSRTLRAASQADKQAVWSVAEKIASEVDRVLSETMPSAVQEANFGAECSCSAPIVGGTVMIKETSVTIPGLQFIFQQCLDRSVAPDDSGSSALLNTVKIYHRILPEDEPAYCTALLAAYSEFCRNKQNR
jgi:hypothetical protein